MANLVTALQGVVAAHPNKAAYVFGEDTVSYEQFFGQVQAMASTLEQKGIDRGDHVALVLGNSPAFLISYFAVLARGGIVIPINPTYTPDEMAYILLDGDVKAIVALSPLVAQAETALTNLPQLKLVISVPYAEVPAIERTGDIEFMPFSKAFASGVTALVKVDEQDVAVILYTSGTTGKPKGALLTHLNLFSNAHSIGEYLEITPDDKALAALPMFHVFCLTVIVNAPLLRGATIIILPKFSPQDVFDLIPKHQVSIFAGVPTMYNFLLQTALKVPTYTSALKHVRVFVSGGASLPVQLLESFEQKFECKILEGYGLSEASPVTCFNPLHGERKAGSIGPSIIHVENKIVDELGEEVGVGEVGELIVRGPNVMKGYYKLPEETSMTLRDGWLYTGDLAKRDEDGYFYIVDRKKDMVIVGGYNVYPREVEEVLYQHPGIVEAAVIGVPDAEQGEAVKAFIVTRDELSVDEIRAFAATKLAKYKQPSHIEIIDELPRNTTGKILRTVLKSEAFQRN
ncbi:long-chain-fatty-acid--CoA ligase [Exiguobacterium aurantiacum]|uniref:long-chain-fatty-acid--CoA ligase n=1 Tax=Exiguobacterium aurantiacum TaxID=33987 RepID=UPI00087754C3|nr:long-chain-fatty-acid--CoA ligase [Exiguobacterium aurantiacum]